ncbi:MAG: flippase-like domain-containing protein [Chloroflexi bacterium]|nr:flippase-like domain-containing protein [Chloroflexota bacterium]
MHKHTPLHTSDPAQTPSAPLPKRARFRVSSRVLLRLLTPLVVVALVLYHRHWLIDALMLLQTVELPWLLAACGTIALSYCVSAAVFHVVLDAFGHRLGALRLWATTVTAIVISQCIPAGGVGSYAFLLRSFKLRGIPASQAALLAALEALSYVGAMLLIGGFSVVYLVAQPLGASNGAAIVPIVAGAVAGGILLATGWVVTRPATTLAHGMRRLLHLFPILRRPSLVARSDAIIADVVRNRDLMLAQPGRVAQLVAIQVVALSGHSLALLLVLQSLGVAPGFGVALAAFGVALLTSTFNVLPGGGGTVETVLVTVLLQLSVGAAALPAAILFRLLNFWALLPIAAASYAWLMRPSGPSSTE